ncbi:MAG: hypothetical protein G01um101456_527 [Parcubacteria group bacterium Gr01-1014_56]|nr:MAG: hypothetical protein G01um101456_527 [Parcubacteria group bacterium Gr01-1014_56]
MLNPFPSLLIYGFFAPTLLRVAAACVLLYIVAIQFRRKEELAKTNFPIIGTVGAVVWVKIIVEAAIAVALFFGYYTQIAAVLGSIVALKQLIFAHTYSAWVPVSRGTSALLLLILLSLLLTGAGAFAFDLPL